MFLKFLIAGFLALFSASSVASVWLAPNDIRLKLDIELLKQSGQLSLPAISWPLYAPDLDRALHNVELAQLSGSQRVAYSRLTRRMAAIKARQLNLDPVKKVRIGYQSSDSNLYGFATPSLRSKGAYIGVNTEQIYKNLSFSIDLVKDKEDYSLDNSYIASSFGDMVVTVGAQSRWWGPARNTNLLWSTQAKPVTGIHLQHRSSVQSPEPWLSVLGPLTAQLFAGRLNSSTTPNTNDDLFNFYAGRLEIQPHQTLRLGFSKLRFNKVNLVANKPVSQNVYGLDVEYGFDGLNFPTSLYAQMAYSDSVGSTSKNYLLGVTVNNLVKTSSSRLSGWLEYTDTRQGLLAEGIDDTAQLDGFARDNHSFAVNHGPGAQGIVLGGIWSHQSGLAIKSWLRHVQWADVGQASARHNALLNSAGAVSGKAYLNSAGLSGEWYPTKYLKVEPSLESQHLNENFSQKLDSVRFGLQISYLIH